LNPTVVETIRGFRGAIAAGSVWLLVLWIGFHNHIDPKQSHSATAKVLGRLAEVLGQTGGLVTLLIVAAAAGSVSQQVFRAPAMWIGIVSTRFVRLAEDVIASVIGRLRRRRVLRRFEGWEPFAVDLARRMVETDATRAKMPTSSMRQAYRLYDRLIREELLDPSRHTTLIHVLDEQANLRFGMVIPLLALTIALGLGLDPWLWVLAPIPFVISFQAGEFRGLCNELLEVATRDEAKAS
jgi:hypothetical protein